MANQKENKQEWDGEIKRIITVRHLNTCSIPVLNGLICKVFNKYWHHHACLIHGIHLKNYLFMLCRFVKNHSLPNLLEFAVQCCVLAALYSGGYSSRPVLLLSTVDLFGEGTQTSLEALCLKLNVMCYAAFFLYHTETTHGGHQVLLLLAELEDLVLTPGQKMYLIRK